MTGPEQHAATVRHALDSGQWGDVRDAAAALDELVALANGWRAVAEDADGNLFVKRAEAAEARADELQRERDEALGEHCVCPEGADGNPCENCGKPEAVTNWKVAYHQARREADQLRAALQFYADDANYRLSLQDAARGRNQPVIDDDGHRARAALAGVQAEEQT